MHVVVVGGGWAGLSVGIDLAASGVRVTLVEAGQELGGRAREIHYRGQRFDNGQHVGLGAYTRLLAKLEQVGVREEEVFERRPLNLHMSRADGADIVIRAPALPAPLNLLAAVVTAKGLTMREQWALFRCMRSMAVTGLDFLRDCTVQEWLIEQRQPAAVINGFWEPLCLAALTTSSTRASLRVFLRVLRDAFSHRQSGSDLLLIKRPLSAVFPLPARRFIEQYHGKVRVGDRVQELMVENGRCFGVKLRDGAIEADHVVLATAPEDARRLLIGYPECVPIGGQLSALFYEPITTVYLRYPRPPTVRAPMMGLLDMTGQWLFDHTPWGEDGLIAVVISGAGKHMRTPRHVLGQQVAAELSERFHDWPVASEIVVLRERRAALACRVDVDRLRPGNATPMAGLWLTGDYTYGRYPSTLEAAVRSGERCAELISSMPRNGGV